MVEFWDLIFFFLEVGFGVHNKILEELKFWKSGVIHSWHITVQKFRRMCDLLNMLRVSVAEESECVISYAHYP